MFFWLFSIPYVKIEKLSKESEDSKAPVRYRTGNGEELILDESGMTLYVTEPYRQYMFRTWQDIEEATKNIKDTKVTHTKGMLREELTHVFDEKGQIDSRVLLPIIEYIKGGSNEIERIRSEH